MKIRGFAMAAACLALVAVVTSSNAEEKKAATVKCPVAGKEIKISDAKTVSYSKATVYVCCDGCKAKLEKDAKKYAVKANHQLFLTKQAKQVKCPIAGRPADASKSVKIAGVSVAFCCGNCQGKAKKATGDAQLALAFSEAAFKKGFTVKAATK